MYHLAAATGALVNTRQECTPAALRSQRYVLQVDGLAKKSRESTSTAFQWALLGGFLMVHETFHLPFRSMSALGDTSHSAPYGGSVLLV
jgi:hypothetical protein